LGAGIEATGDGSRATDIESVKVTEH
jgi:hypothetical protein